MNFHSFKQPRTLEVGRYIALLEKALERKPDSLNILFNLAKSKLQLEAFDAAEQYIKQLLNSKKITDDTIVGIIKMYFAAHLNEKAYELITEFKESKKTNPIIIHLEAKLLLRLKKNDEASKLIEKLLILFPNYEGTLQLDLEQTYKRKDFFNTVIKSKAILTRNTKNTKAKKYLINALYYSNKLEKSKVSENYDQIIRIFSLKDDMVSIVNFNNKLNEVLFSKDDWLINPVRYTTSNGDQLSDLFTYNNKIFKELKSILEQKILAYIQMVQSEDISYFSSLPQILSFNVWAVKLKQGGHQEAHIHPGGWISGVYYTKLPALDNVMNEGALEFGIKTPEGIFESMKIIHPDEGSLVLFPSYLLHRTIPFKSKGLRICISFDVFPYKGN